MIRFFFSWPYSVENLRLLDLVLDKLDDLKSQNVQTLDVRGKSSETDFMIVCSGTSNRHTRSIAAYLISELRKRQLPVLGIEGERYGEWVLIDLGEVVVHVMQQEHRDFYQLEKLWAA